MFNERLKGAILTRFPTQSIFIEKEKNQSKFIQWNYQLKCLGRSSFFKIYIKIFFFSPERALFRSTDLRPVEWCDFI